MGRVRAQFRTVIAQFRARAAVDHVLQNVVASNVYTGCYLTILKRSQHHVDCLEVPFLGNCAGVTYLTREGWKFGHVLRERGLQSEAKLVGIVGSL